MPARPWTLGITAVVASACLSCWPHNPAQAQVGVRQVDPPKVAAVKPKPETETAKKASLALDEELEFGEVDVSVGELDRFLEQQLDAVAVFLDRRGMQVAKVDDQQRIQTRLPKLPLRAALRKMLRPLALKVSVEDEGLVITADYRELARRGIATDRWTHGASQAAEAVIRKMDQPIRINAIEQPLLELIAGLSQQMDLPMLIDNRALEEIGLSAEEPVTLRLANVSLRSGLRLLLRDLDLTYQIGDEVLQITTVEAAEMNLNNRIYYLDGLGRPEDAGSSMRSVISACIVPDTWEQLGGPSSIIPLIADERPAIIVSTTSDVHDQIKALLESLRKAGSPEGIPVDVPQREF